MQEYVPKYRIRSRKSSCVNSQAAGEPLEYMALVNQRDCYGALIGALYPNAPPVKTPSAQGMYKPYLWNEEPHASHHFRIR
jgi:hypothetical protein